MKVNLLEHQARSLFRLEESTPFYSYRCISSKALLVAGAGFCWLPEFFLGLIPREAEAIPLRYGMILLVMLPVYLL